MRPFEQVTSIPKTLFALTMTGVLAGTAMLLSMSTSPVTAQTWIGTAGLYQKGDLVGLIWTPPSADACNYTEYWYVGPDYVYPNSPGPGMSIETVLKSAVHSPRFRDRADFYEYARELVPGGKRIVVFAAELEDCGY